MDRCREFGFRARIDRRVFGGKSANSDYNEDDEKAEINRNVLGIVKSGVAGVFSDKLHSGFVESRDAQKICGNEIESQQLPQQSPEGKGPITLPSIYTCFVRLGRTWDQSRGDPRILFIFISNRFRHSKIVCDRHGQARRLPGGDQMEQGRGIRAARYGQEEARRRTEPLEELRKRRNAGERPPDQQRARFNSRSTPERTSGEAAG